MKNRYMIVKHYVVPAPNTNTSMKNYGNEGKKLVDERIMFSNKVNYNRHMYEATFIFDLKEMKIVKNRQGNIDDEALLNHYLKEYEKEIRQATRV